MTDEYVEVDVVGPDGVLAHDPPVVVGSNHLLVNSGIS